jgi:hypothetical protein
MRDKVGAEQLQQVHHCTTRTGGSDCGPEGQRSAPSGSRRAAIGVRNNRRVCSETVEDHDRRFWYRWPLTWRSSHTFTVLNTTQFHVRRLGTDLARRKPGVQIPSPPPPQQCHRPGGSLPPAGVPPDLPLAWLAVMVAAVAAVAMAPRMAAGRGRPHRARLPRWLGHPRRARLRPGRAGQDRLGVRPPPPRRWPGPVVALGGRRRGHNHAGSVVARLAGALAPTVLRSARPIADR